MIYAKHIAARVPTLMLIIAACFAGLGFISVLLVRKNPSFEEQSILINQRELSIKEALCEKQYWILCLMDFLTIFPLFYMSSIYKVMGMQIGGYDDKLLTWIGSIGSLANGLSIIVWGPLQDKIGFRSIYQIVICMELLVCALMPVIVNTNKHLYMLWVFMGFLGLGAHFVIFPNCIITIFGLRSSV